jgi:glyoxylase-like metal-dependent hydrolase (beta-lactamase superfamily II)
LAEPLTIDTRMHGHESITASYVLRGEKTALVETGPKSSVEHVIAGLEAAGVESLHWIVVTHIHLDHAGAAGTLARRYPDATVAVHHVGAPHLADPSKLWSSAARIYGDAMDRLWGGIDPIEPDRIRALEDGDKVDLGGRVLTAVDTPGHAYHHHAFLDDATGIVFTGDALGVRLADAGIIRPATPPPEFHLEKALSSIERIRELRPAELWLTHFGPHNRGANVKDVDSTCDEAAAALRRWDGWVRSARHQSTDLDEVTRIVRAEARAAMEGDLSRELVERMENTTSYRMNVWGYMRYLDKSEASGAG